MRKKSLDMVHRLARQDPRVVFVGSDLGHGTLEGMRAEFPDRFFMEGIQEAHVVGMAAGLALDGKIVYANTIAPFFTRRALDQIIVDLCMHKANVRLIASGGGMVYAPLGPTHEVTEDIAILRSLPNMTILAVADAEEMERAMPRTLEHQGPIYIRLAKGFDPVVTRPEWGFEIGRGIVARPGTDALIVTTGICLGAALESADTLAAEGISAMVVHLPTIKPLDENLILEAAVGKRAVVSIEEHSVIGGLGGALSELLMERGAHPLPRFRRLGVPDVFPGHYGTQAELMAFYGISAANLTDSVRSLVGAT